MAKKKATKAPEAVGDHEECLLTPYPTDLSEPSKVLLRYYTGDVPAAEAVHAGYQVLGVGLGTLLPHPDHTHSPAKGSGGGESKDESGGEDFPWKRPDGFKVTEEGCEPPCDPDCCTEDQKIEALEAACSMRGGETTLDPTMLRFIISAAMEVILKWLSGKLNQ